MVVQNISRAGEGKTDITFTLPKGDGPRAVAALEARQASIGFEPDHLQRPHRQGVAGRRRHALAPGVTATFCEALADAGVNIEHHHHLGDPHLGAGPRHRSRRRRPGECTTAFDLGGDERGRRLRRDRTMMAAGDGGTAGRHRRRHRPGRRGDAADPGRAGLPGRRDPVLRLGALGRQHAAVGRPARSWSRTPPPPTRPASTSRCSPPAATTSRAQAPRFAAAGRDRGRQLLGLADGPRRAAGGQRGQPGRACAETRARASSPTRTAPRWPRCRCSSRCTTRPGWCGWSPAPTRRCPAAGWPASRSWTAQVAAVGDKAAELTHDGSAVDASRRRRSTSRPIAFNVLPMAGSVVDDGSLRDRRGAEAPQREPQDPRHPRPAGLRHLRAGAGVHRALAVDQRRVRRGRCRSSGPPSCSPTAPGVRAVRRPDAAAGRRAATRATSAGSGRTRASTAAAGWRCSSATTTCARAPPSTPSRSRS